MALRNPTKHIIGDFSPRWDFTHNEPPHIAHSIRRIGGYFFAELKVQLLPYEEKYNYTAPDLHVSALVTQH